MRRQNTYEKPSWSRKSQLAARQLLYAVVTSDSKYIKIGVSLAPFDRLSAMRVDCPLGLEIALIVPQTSAGLEEEVHKLLRASRARGEWFHLTDEVCSWLERVAQLPDAKLFPDKKAIAEDLSLKVLAELFQ